MADPVAYGPVAVAWPKEDSSIKSLNEVLEAKPSREASVSSVQGGLVTNDDHSPLDG